MRIWHVGAASSPNRVDGVSRTVWLLSRQQALLGHQVSLVIDTPPDETAIEIAKQAGIKLIHVQATAMSYRAEIRRIVESEKPQIVHMHSVFIVRQAALGKVLHQYGIPYLITPHAGLAPQVLRRGVLKKTIYTLLRERPRFMQSSAIALVTPAEERFVRSFVPNYRKPIVWMPNPVDVENLDPHRWKGMCLPRRLVFLGRFDVVVKGIDILIEIARLVPEVQFDLYGTEDPRTRDALNELKRNMFGNIAFHDPIFGADKARMLSEASLYIQPSRWEGFPVSVAECMYLGVPSVVADTLDLAQLFFQHDLGLVIPIDPPRAAAQIRAAMADHQRLGEWSERSRQFALDHFHPQAVAQKHVDFYQEILHTHESRQPHARSNGNGHNGSANGHAAAKPWQLVSTPLRGIVKSNVSRLVERSNRLMGSNGVPRTVVLCYHSINTSDADLAVDPSVFRRQILRLKETGFEFWTFGDLVYRLMRWGLPDRNVACVTFDDGYEDNLTQAAPILAELKVPATTFVTTGLMAHDASVLERFIALTHYETSFLSPRQVEELSRCGFEIGAHTHTHANLALLSREKARQEVVQSKAMLESVLGRAVRSFAYPFGKRNIHYTEATIAAVRESGLTGAAAVAFRAVTARQAIRAFEIPRFFINRSDTELSFEQKIHGHFDWLGSLQESTPAWLKAAVSPEDRYV